MADQWQGVPFLTMLVAAGVAQLPLASLYQHWFALPSAYQADPVLSEARHQFLWGQVAGQFRVSIELDCLRWSERLHQSDR
jgi:hypothetical protein